MKYFLSIFPVLALLLFSRSCDERVETPTGPALGDTLSMVYGQSVLIPAEGITLSFQEYKDSRCPEGVNCIRQGEAKVFLGFKHVDTGKTLEMEVQGLCKDRSGDCGEKKALLGYTVHLLTADPYPTQDSKPEKSETVIRVVVSKTSN